MYPSWRTYAGLPSTDIGGVLDAAGVSAGPRGHWADTLGRLSGHGPGSGTTGPYDRDYSAVTATHVVSAYWKDGSGMWYGDAQPLGSAEWAAGLSFPPCPPG